MLQKRIPLLLLCLFCLLVLCSCAASNGLPITDIEPSVTLPPAQLHDAAPIGDASLEHAQSVTLYLPSHDGISLTAIETEVSYSPTRPKAETLVRALLAHSATKEAATLGGNVHLSLYGTSPVEVSRDIATINLSASALQLDREKLFLACQAIANTLTQLPELSYVNFLVVDKPIGLDVSNTLPMGALGYSPAQDLGAVYEQMLSRRVDSNDKPESTPLSANVALYFSLNETQGMVGEVHAMSFENQVFADMVTAILRELATGPKDETILSPSLPLLADLLSASPVLRSSAETGENVIELDFAHNLVDMLEAYGISRKQCLASLSYTFTTFFPNVSGVSVSINGSPLEEDSLAEEETDSKGEKQVHARAEFSDMLYDYCTLYFASETDDALIASRRPIPYYQTTHPRILLKELSRGPQLCDSHPELHPVMNSFDFNDTTILGFSFSDGTLLANFSPAFSSIGENMEPEEERLLAYAMVNTLCMDEHIKSVCFFQSGSQFDGFTGEIYWAGLFYPLPY